MATSLKARKRYLFWKIKIKKQKIVNNKNCFIYFLLYIHILAQLIEICSFICFKVCTIISKDLNTGLTQNTNTKSFTTWSKNNFCVTLCTYSRTFFESLIIMRYYCIRSFRASFTYLIVQRASETGRAMTHNSGNTQVALYFIKLFEKKTNTSLNIVFVF